MNFIHGDLRSHTQRILDHIHSGGESGEPPHADFIADNGEGHHTWVIDLPMIEESYLYPNVIDRDTDLRNLRSFIRNAKNI